MSAICSVWSEILARRPRNGSFRGIVAAVTLVNAALWMPIAQSARVPSSQKPGSSAPAHAWRPRAHGVPVLGPPLSGLALCAAQRQSPRLGKAPGTIEVAFSVRSCAPFEPKTLLLLTRPILQHLRKTGQVLADAATALPVTC